MSRFAITLEAKGMSLASLEKQLRATIKGREMEFTITPVKEAGSRSARLAAAMADVETAASEVESLREELESWKDNLPESLQDGEKAGALEEAMDALEQVKEKLEEATQAAEAIDFPGMY